MSKTHKVFDCFPFYNELDLLEIRLNVLNDVVDYFVLTESTRTFTGKEKPLFYAENKKRFKRFAHKIRHVIVDDSEYDPKTDVWQREFDQKNSVFRGLDDCRDDDFVIVSDVDEIVKPDLIIKFIKERPNAIAIIKQPCYYYYLNCQSTEVFDKAKMARFKNIESPQQIRAYPKFSKHSSNKLVKILFKWYGSVRKRLCVKLGSCVIYENGGWHFTYMKSPEEISDKMTDFSHTEYNLDKFTSVNSIQSRMKIFKDPYDRNYQLKVVEIDSSFPDYIVNNQKKYDHIIYKKIV
jgi:hypothetical protein